MNKRYRVNGKAIKWINTRFAKQYKVRQSIKTIMCAQVSAVAVCRVNAIKSSASASSVEKAVAISKVIIDSQSAMLKIYEAVK